MKELPEQFQAYDIFHVLEKHGQNETIWMSCTAEDSSQQYAVQISQRYGWNNVRTFSIAWTLELLFTSCEDCRKQKAHDCKSNSFSHFVSQSGKLHNVKITFRRLFTYERACIV